MRALQLADAFLVAHAFSWAKYRDKPSMHETTITAALPCTLRFHPPAHALPPPCKTWGTWDASTGGYLSY